MPEWKVANYINNDIRLEFRISLSKLRCSVHNLNVETGRNRGVIYKQRLCIPCDKHEIEDEFHFVVMLSAIQSNATSVFAKCWHENCFHRYILQSFQSFRARNITSGKIYLNAKVSQLLLKCYFLLLELKILLHDIMINKSNDLPSKQHENQTSETYDCRSSTRNVRQPKFEKSQSYNTLHFIESQCYTTLHFIRKRCLTVIFFQNQKGRQIQAGYLII